MSVKFLSDIEVKAGLRDSSGSLGASGQILSSTSGNVSWVTPTINTVARDVQNQVKAGVAITKGQAVYVTGADGTNIIVGLASNTSEATSSKTLGLLNATVSVNGSADVVQIGRLSGLNTIGATAGDPVWLGTNGNLIYGLANKPYAPAHLVFIGIVTRVNTNNGEIFVSVQNGFELNEIHDVDLKTNVPINGDVLGFNGTLWVNKTIAQWLGYTPANASGTTNYVSKFTGATTLGNSQIFDNASGVGIGTTAPSEKLDVYGVIRGVYTTDPGAGAVTGKFLAYSPAAYGLVFRGYGTGTHSIQVQREANNAETFPLSLQPNGGNVGIGTTSPSEKLTINGGALRLESATGVSSYVHYISPGNDEWSAGMNGAYDFQIAYSNGLGTPRMTLLKGGNVGIGTTGPSKLLDVNGDALINGLTIGRGSGNSIQNVAVGGVALYSNTSGSGNVAIGYYTLSLNTSGNGNVAVGNASLSSITSGSDNTAIGTASLGNLDAGNYNTCIGTRAGESTTNASGMTLIGCNLKYKPNNISLLGDNELAIAQQVSSANGLVHFYAPDTVSVAATSAGNVLIVDPLAYSAVFLDYMIDDLYDNLRAGTIKAIFRNNLLAIEWDESATASIGSTLDYIFNVQDNGSGLLAITLTNNNPDNPVFCRLTSRILLRVN
jgi:hypothetical protein